VNRSSGLKVPETHHEDQLWARARDLFDRLDELAEALRPRGSEEVGRDLVGRNPEKRLRDAWTPVKAAELALREVMLKMLIRRLDRGPRPRGAPIAEATWAEAQAVRSLVVRNGATVNEAIWAVCPAGTGRDAQRIRRAYNKLIQLLHPTCDAEGCVDWKQGLIATQFCDLDSELAQQAEERLEDQRRVRK
jgi:hypothetical protein